MSFRGVRTGTEYAVACHYDNAGSGGQLTGTGRFKRITGPGLPTYGVQYSYTANGDLLAGWKFKTGSDDSTTVAWVSRGYESNRDLIDSVENWATYLDTFSSYTYAYDELGRRKSVVDGSTEFDPAELSKWGYNPRSELVSAHRYEGDDPDDPGDEITAERRLYTYDQIGNRQDTTVGNYSTPTLRYCADDLNRYNQTYTGSQQTCPVASPAESFAYDDDGNLTQDGTFNYTWDAENRLKTVTPRNPTPGAKKVRFVYDYMGRRVQKAVYVYNNGWPADDDPDERWHFVYDGWNVVMVLNGLDGDDPGTEPDNTLERRFTWGLDLSGTLHGAGGIGGLLAVEETAAPGSPSYWFFYDGNGNVGQILDATNTSNITIAARYEYDPYGNVIGPDLDRDGDWQDDATPYALANPIRFSTKWYDVETDMYYYGRRYYLPRLGRWGNEDPAAECGGLNLYAFVHNNAVDWVDLLGLRTLEDYERCLLCLLFPEGALKKARIEVGVPEEVDGSSLWAEFVRLLQQMGNVVTVNSTMYFPFDPDTTDEYMMGLLAHELRHTQQYEAAGDKSNFIKVYVWYLRRGRWIVRGMKAYKENPFEVDANVFLDCTRDLLKTHSELTKALGGQDPDREVCCLTDLYWEKYKQTVNKCLSAAKKVKTTFRIPYDGQWSFEFYLKGDYSTPVGGTIDLSEQDTSFRRPPRGQEPPGWYE